MVAVTGDPLSNNGYVVAHNGLRGYPVSKLIRHYKGLRAAAA